MALSDEDIHKMAKARVGFKQHAGTYVIINAMLAVMWFIITPGPERSLPSYWPVWTHLGWGVGLAFHGFSAYGPQKASIAREEERIRQRNG